MLLLEQNERLLKQNESLIDNNKQLLACLQNNNSVNSTLQNTFLQPLRGFPLKNMEDFHSFNLEENANVIQQVVKFLTFNHFPFSIVINIESLFNEK